MPSKQQLQEWYKKFSEILKREADIDVNDINDLTRVKNIQITKWDTTNPEMPDIDINYAYAPHKGNKPVNPVPLTANAQTQEQWLNENLKPAVSDDQILQLYNMSREGTLMIHTVADGLKNIQMVRTEPDGTIVTSRPASAYRFERNDKLPESERVPKQPEKPDYSLNPEDYGIAPKPVAPPEPANMEPSIWSIIAYFLFRVNNDYAKLRQYNLDKMAYDEVLANWERDVEHSEDRVVTDAATGEERTVDYTEFRIARNAHDLYAQQFASYQNDPLAKFKAIASSTEKLMAIDRSMPGVHNPMKAFWIREKNLVEGKYKAQPRGAAELLLDDCKKILGFEERTDIMLHNWLGHNANPQRTLEYFDFDLYGFQLTQMELPKSPDFDQMTPDAQASHTKFMSDLFDMAALSAMADPDLTAHTDKPGKTRKDTAENVFNHVFNDAVTHGRPDLRGYYQHFEPTRQKALEAMTAYSQGDKSQLAKLLGMGMQNMLKNGHILSSFSTYGINTTYMIGKLYNLLHQDKDLLQASGLKEEELQDAKAHMELYKHMRQGIRAKANILEHANGKLTLTPEQLQKAAGDVLMFHHVILGLGAGWKKNDQALQETEEYKQLMDSFMRPKMENGVQLYNADGSIRMESADPLTIETNKNKIDVMNNNLPANEFTLGLLDKEAVRKYRDMLLENADFSKLGEMSRDQLRDLFATKDNSKIASFLMSPKEKPAPQQDGPNMHKEIANEQQKGVITNMLG